jgi:hypothetical protein
MSQTKEDQIIDLELARVFVGPQVVTVRAGQLGSAAILRNMNESDANALRRALPAFSNKRLKKQLSKLADSFDGLCPRPLQPENKPKRKTTGWATLGAFR